MATTPYPFVAQTVLTASQLNSTFNIPVTTVTANHTLVAGNAGTRLVMNAASATTITVNTSIFSAGDNLEISNIGAGVTTLTAGTATVSSAGPLAIPQFGGGTLYFTSAGVAIFFPSAGPAPTSGLVCVKAETAFTSAASVTADNVFTSSYTNYLVKLLYKTDVAIRVGLRIGGVTTATGYNRVQLRVEGVTPGVTNLSNQTGFQVGEQTSASLLEATSEIFIYAPQLAQRTFLWSTNMHNQSGYAGSSQFGDTGYGNQNSTTQFDGLEFNGASTMTATGTYTIYGYAKTV